MMPTRLIDFDAMWASDKLDACAVWARREYSWLYGLADAHGSFELTNLKVIFGRVAAIRDDLSIERLGQVFDNFHDNGLLFKWEENGTRYGHWTNCEARLPSKSLRDRYARPAPPVPQSELQEYLARYSASMVEPVKTTSRPTHDAVLTGDGLGDGDGLGNGNTQPDGAEPSAPGACADLLAFWNENRGQLPEVLRLTKGRASKSLPRIKSDPKFPETFKRAVLKARETPFCAGAGGRGWKANFDWFIANDTNCVAVLEGKYDDGKGGLCHADERTRENLRAAGLLN